MKGAMPKFRRFYTHAADIEYAEEGAIFAPVMDGLPAGVASVLAALPIHDANEILLSATAGARNIAAGVCVAVFTIDPFRTTDNLLKDLSAAGFRHLVNWPSVSFMGAETEREMESLGFGYDREVEFAAHAVKEGWTVTGTVLDARQALKMLSAGCTQLIFYPSPNAISLSYKNDAALGEFADVREVARRHGRCVSIYAEVPAGIDLPRESAFGIAYYRGAGDSGPSA
jgi:hypothetical protein